MKSSQHLEGTYKQAQKTLKSLLLSNRPRSLLARSPQTQQKSRTSGLVQKENAIIQKENFRLHEKILKVRSSFSVKSWKKDYLKSRKYLKIKQKFSRPSSRITSKRTLIDTVNLPLSKY